MSLSAALVAAGAWLLLALGLAFGLGRMIGIADRRRRQQLRPHRGERRSGRRGRP